MNVLTEDYIKGVIEALLFVSDKPVSLDQIKDVLGGVGGAQIKKHIQELMEEFEEKRRGMVIMEIAGGYQMLSSPHYVSYVREFFKTRVKDKLSRPALETLAIIAYKQPVSRADIEVIRGVNSDGVVLHLLNKGLIKIVGRKDAPGRPYVHGTTKLFLEYFGLRSLDDLPKLEEFSEMIYSKESQENILPDDDIVVATDSSEGSVEELTESASGSDLVASAEGEVQQSEELDESLEGEEINCSGDATALKQVMDEINKEESPEDKKIKQDEGPIPETINEDAVTVSADNAAPETPEP